MTRPARSGLRAAVIVAAGTAVLTATVVTALMPGTTSQGASAVAPPRSEDTPIAAAPARPTSPPAGPTLPTATTPVPVSAHAATAVVTSYANAADTLTPTSDLAALRTAVSGQALAELQAQQLEFAANGWTATGTTRVSDVTVLRTTGSGSSRTVEVQACVDSSKVHVLTAAGKSAFPTTTGTRRALNLYDLQETAAGWRVTRHSYPADPTC
jgi:hypothetical protein